MRWRTQPRAKLVAHQISRASFAVLRGERRLCMGIVHSVSGLPLFGGAPNGVNNLASLPHSLSIYYMQARK